MTVTAFSGLTAAVKDLLLQAPPVANGNVSRRVRPLQQGQASAVVVLPVVADEQPGMTSGPVDWTTTLVLELQARSQPSQDPEDALDPLLAEVFARLRLLPQVMPSAVSGLGQSRIEWDFQEADSGLVVARLAVGVEHRTAAASLVAAP